MVACPGGYTSVSHQRDEKTSHHQPPFALTPTQTHDLRACHISPGPSSVIRNFRVLTIYGLRAQIYRRNGDVRCDCLAHHMSQT
jgi:hypothetical protein